MALPPPHPPLPPRKGCSHAVFSSLDKHMLETCNSGIPKQKNSYRINQRLLQGLANAGTKNKVSFQQKAQVNIDMGLA